MQLLEAERDAATRQAWDALGRYKFWMFGYYAARVVYLGQLIERQGGGHQRNPFAELVAIAREHRDRA